MKIGLINALKPKSAFLDVKSNGDFSSEILSGVLENRKDGYFKNGVKISPDSATSLTFKGIRSEKILQTSENLMESLRNTYLKHTVQGGFEISDYSKFVKNTNKAVGNGFVESYVNEFRRQMGSKSSEFLELKDNKLIVHDKTLPGKLAAGLWDVAKLPIDIYGAMVSGLQKIPKVKNTKIVKKLADASFLQNRKQQKETMELFYIIKGFKDYANNPKGLKEAMLKVPAGKPVGNYNTKDERALNRLATGFVSSLFVGTDFYNLVMYEKNNEKEAKEAGNKRVKREMMRIGLSAFMTYTVLGSLSSYVNKSKALACAAIAGSSLFSEVATRLISGVPLLPLSPEGAKEYNKKQIKKGKNPLIKNDANKPEAYRGISLMPENNTNIFANNLQKASSDKNMQAEDTKKNHSAKPDNKNSDRNKSPLTLKRVGLAIAAAFAFDIIYSVVRTKSATFDNLIKNVSKELKYFYDRNTKKELILSTKELKHFLKGFDNNNLEGVKKSYEGIFDIDYDKLKNATRGAQESHYIIKGKNVINSLYGNEDNVGYTMYNLKSITVEMKKVNRKSKEDVTELPVLESAVFNFGRVQEKKIKAVVDALLYPVKALKSLIAAPVKPLLGLSKKTAPLPPPKAEGNYADIGELYNDCTTMYRKYLKGKISMADFQEYIRFVNTKPLNTDTSAKYPQTALASLSRNFVTLISSYFFINDFRNEILIQSNGENTQKASEVTKERTAHKMSNYVLNKFFMELFNKTFAKQYLGSLAGATAVAAATELTNESTVRLSIGVPLDKKSSRDEIDVFEKKHIEKKGIVGAYYRLMARITGKKMLSEKAEKK